MPCLCRMTNHDHFLTWIEASLRYLKNTQISLFQVVVNIYSKPSRVLPSENAHFTEVVYVKRLYGFYDIRKDVLRERVNISILVTFRKS